MTKRHLDFLAQRIAPCREEEGIHGGMGFTSEHPAHLHFKQAKASSPMFGNQLTHRSEVARALGL